MDAIKEILANGFVTFMIQYVMPTLFMLLSVAIIAGIGHLANKARQSSKSELFYNLVTQLETIITTIIRSFFENQSKAIKKAAADGKITPEEKAELLAKVGADAKNAVLKQLPKALMKALEPFVGDVNEFVNHKIEVAYADVKAFFSDSKSAPARVADPMGATPSS